MRVKRILRLLEEAEQRIREAAENKEQSQYWQGRADSYREMLNTETQISSKALYNSKISPCKEGSPAFIKSYNRTAEYLGLPLLSPMQTA